MGRTGRQLVYDLSFVIVDKLDTVRTGWKCVWEFIFLERQQCALILRLQWKKWLLVGLILWLWSRI